MALSDSEVKTCSKTCLKNHETLKKQYDDLRTEFNKSQSNLANYKRGLASVEERLVFYKKNEVMFCEQIVVLKRDITYKDSDISVLKCELEKLKKEKESNKLKLDKFENASKSLDKLIGSQISDNSRKGVGFVSYNVVPPPSTGLFAPPTIDLFNSGLEEFQQPEFKGYGPKTSKSVSEVEPKKVRKNDGAPIIEDWVSDDEEQDESKPKSEKKTVIPTVKKIEFVRPKQQEKPVRKPVKYAEIYRSVMAWVSKKVCFSYLQGNPETELEDSVRLNSPEDKKQYDDLRIELSQSEFNLANSKEISSMEEDYLSTRIYGFKIDNFENASKSLDKLILIQISDNKRKGVGYNAVAPPPTGLFAPPTIVLSSSGLEEFQQPEFEGYGLRANKSVCKNSSNETKKNYDAESPVVVEKKTIVPIIPKVDVVRPKQQEKPVRKTVRSGPISLNTARQNHFNAVRTNWVNAVNVCNGLGSQEGLIFLFVGQPRDRIGRLNQFDDGKRAGAELTQENDKSQYTKCLDTSS
ncbi:hypothetical protein Tco_0846005 [Tanacetum coccineum]